MKTYQLAVIATLVAAASSAFADPLTRADVRQSVVEARNAGQLMPAGEAGDAPAARPVQQSTVTRSEVRQDVIEARADGALIPAGEQGDAFFGEPQTVAASGLTRVQVKAATMQARDEGKLIPAGDLDDASLAREQAQAAYARAHWLAHRHAAMLASGQ